MHLHPRLQHTALFAASFILIRRRAEFTTAAITAECGQNTRTMRPESVGAWHATAVCKLLDTRGDQVADTRQLANI